MTDDEIIPELSDEVLRIAYADAVRCYPEEACGLIVGPKGAAQCDEARPCTNQQNRLHARDATTYSRDARTAYALGIADLRFLDESLGSARPVKIIYHSHVEVGAYFSDEDRRAATFEDELIYPVDYLVIDCAKQGVRGAKLFRYQAGQFVAIREFPAG
jgi:adenylyltransferase/sulfurtransferase